MSQNLHFQEVEVADIEVSKMTGMVMKLSDGTFREPKEAEAFLLGFCIMSIGISAFLLFSMGVGPHIPIPSGTQIVYSSKTPPRLIRLLVFSELKNELK